MTKQEKKSRNYDRNDVIWKLKNRRLKAMPNINDLQYFERNQYGQSIGIKMLGMIDFLSVHLVTKKAKKISKNVKTKNKNLYDKSIFFRKNCCICKERAMAHRFYEGKESYICNNSSCDRIWRDRNGLTLDFMKSI